MKISPVAMPSGSPQSSEVSTGSSVSPERYAKAVAAITGEAPAPVAADPQIERAKASIQKIRMNTQRSVNRYGNAPVIQDTPNVEPQGDILANSEPTEAAAEETKPLSPQFAAIAKAKRAAQQKEAAIAQREAALAKQEADMKAAVEKLARLKANPLSVLQEEGITYDQLTENILNQNQMNPDVLALKEELKAVREEFTKSQEQRDALQKDQALKMIRKDVDALINQGDDFETIREAGYAPKVVELIDRWFSETGDILDTQEAAKLVESELLEEALRFAQLKKVQSRLKPTPQQSQPAQTVGNKPPLKTLTSRSGTSAPASARERAIAAFYGKL